MGGSIAGGLSKGSSKGMISSPRPGASSAGSFNSSSSGSGNSVAKKFDFFSISILV